jgi:hypothetical protein
VSSRNLNCLRARYQAVPDGALLKLFQEGEQLTPEAMDALQGELLRRGIDPDVELSRTVPDEMEATDDASPSSHLEAQELPEDFFDDKDDDAPTSVAATRPRGVTVIAFLCWLGSVGSLVMALTEISEGHRLAAAFIIALIVFQIVTGIALFRMRRWSLYAAIVLFSLNIVSAAFFISSAAILRLRGGEPNQLQAVSDFFGFIYSGVVVTLYQVQCIVPTFGIDDVGCSARPPSRTCLSPVAAFRFCPAKGSLMSIVTRDNCCLSTVSLLPSLQPIN